MTNLERQLNFIRPAFEGYTCRIEAMIKTIKVTNLNLCIFPVRCSFTGKSLFMRKAVRVSVKDAIWRQENKTRYYDVNVFTQLSLML